MDRQEGYYWVKKKKKHFEVVKWNARQKWWERVGIEDTYDDSDFEHINEVKIKEPGELPEL